MEVVVVVLPGHQVVKSSSVLYGAAQERVWSQEGFQCCSLSSPNMILLDAPAMYMTIRHQTPDTRRLSSDF
jgi:hypothetical protein